MPTDYLRFRRDALREELLERPSDPPVELLPLALEQRLVRRVLDERVLEQIGRLGQHPSLVEKLLAHRDRECLLELGLLHGGNRE